MNIFESKSQYLNMFSLEFLVQRNENHEPGAVHKTRQFYNACLVSTKGVIQSNKLYL